MSLLLWLPFVFVLGVLVCVCVFDVRERVVSDWVWVFVYPVGFVLTFVLVGFGLLDWVVVLVSGLCSLFLGVGLFWSGYYGGADLKALVFIALTAPSIPVVFGPVLNLPELPLILTVFCNSVLLSLTWPLTIFTLNLKDALKGKRMFEDIQLSWSQKVWLFFTSRLTPIEKMVGLRYFPSEQLVFQEDDGGLPIRKHLRFVKAETDLSKYTNDLNTYKHLYKKGVLASPTIPTIVFFTIALAITPLGNIFIWAIILIGII